MQEINIDVLGFSTRTSNCLKRAEIFFLSQVMDLTVSQMSDMKNMGAKSIKEILDFQEKVKNDDTFEWQWSVENPRCKDKKIGPILMIHKAFPQFVGKEIIDISFKSQNGLMLSDIDVSELQFSVRTENCLKNNNIKTIKELALKEHSQVTDFKNMGSKSVNELIFYLRDFAVCTLEGQKINTFVTDVYSLISNKIKLQNACFDIRSMETVIKQAISKLEEKVEYETIEELNQWLEEAGELTKIIVSPEIIGNIEQYLYFTFFGNRNTVMLSTIEEKIPRLFLCEHVHLLALENLITKNKIEMFQSGYRKHFPNVEDWMELIGDNEKSAVSLRLSGKTLEECGQEMGITRERVRQLVVQALRKKPELKEDEYAYWYSEYNLDLEAMQAIFDVDTVLFYYLAAVYKSGDKPVEDMIEDANLNSKIYSRLFEFINRDSILIGNNYVPCKRDILCRELAKEYYSNKETTFEEFYEEYLRVLTDNGIADNPKLLFPSERAFEARLQDSQYILMKYGRRFRYYPINEYDIEQLVKDLHLEQFSNVEISTLKLFNEHQDLMVEFDIQDEYELHNLLKKTEAIWNPKVYDAVLTRMPFMSFGTVNRAKQTEDLLLQIAPVSSEEFCEFYEMEYGVLTRTVYANMCQYISNYYHNGVYKIDQPLFDPLEENFMRSILFEDFYFIEDVKKLFVNKFGDKNISHINARTLKELGYRVYTNYIVSNKYLSADEYFTKYLLEKPVIDLEKWDSRISYVQQAWAALDTLRKGYDILEFEDKKYIRYDHFSNVVNHLTKEDLLLYVDDVLSFEKEEDFFSIKSIKNKGFESEIHNLGFPDWFGGALVKNSRKLNYIKAGGTIIFYRGEVQRTTTDFLLYVMKKLRKMDIELFLEYLANEFGIFFAKEKITWIIRDTGMYYDSIMKKIYYNKEEYYDDI